MGVTSEIDRICCNIIEDKLLKYERVAKSFSKFFEQDELERIIDRKADIELV